MIKIGINGTGSSGQITRLFETGPIDLIARLMCHGSVPGKTVQAERSASI